MPTHRQRYGWMRLLGAVILVLAALSIRVLAQFPQIPIPELPGGNPFGSNIKLKGSEPISTSFADAKNELVLPDTFSPKMFKRLLGLPRGPGGGFMLSPGAYEVVFQSFCLEAGTHGPSRGDGYLYAPLKGSKAAIILSLLRGAAQHPEIRQGQIQLLIWAVESRSKFGDLPQTLQLAALTLLTKKEVVDLNGGALGLIPQTLLDRAMNSIPPEERRILEVQAELRSKLADANSTFAEIERLAVLAGPAKRDGPMIPRGRWSSHPGGFFIRYLPNGYKQTQIQVYVPEQRPSRRASSHPIEHLQYSILERGEAAARASTTTEYDPTLDVAVPADTGAQRLGLSEAGTKIPSNATPSETGPSGSNSGHHKVDVPCPGTRANAITIASASQSVLGLEHLLNTGSCQLSIQALDKNGNPLVPIPNTRESTLVLAPGQSINKWVPPHGTVRIIVACFSTCSGKSSLEYDDILGMT